MVVRTLEVLLDAEARDGSACQVQLFEAFEGQ